MKTSILFCCGILLAGWPALAAKESAVQIVPLDQWTTVFGGAEAKLRFEIRSSQALTAVVRWNHRYANRMLQSGQSAVQVAAAGSSTVTVPLRFGEVQEGVILPTEFSLSVAAQGDGQPLAEFERRITIFPPNAFFERTAWLKALQIQLFDPQGDTAERLENASVPFTRVHNLAALEDASTKLLIVGEGVSFLKYRQLPEVMQQLAAKGVGVLCLAPQAGSLPYPTRDGQTPLRSVSFADHSIIPKIEKLLDAEQWQTVEQIAGARFEVQSRRGRVEIEMSNNSHGWPWLEIEYPQNGHLVYCGFSLIEHWDAGPTPRYLLLNLIERLAGEFHPEPSRTH